jgi:hypothetical protein
MKAFAPDWEGAVPYTAIIGPDGRTLHASRGPLDILEARRIILASFPDDDYVGQNAYWNSK